MGRPLAALWGANQTLAALALLVATVWLANWSDSKQLLSTGAPMAAMFVVTTVALLYLAFYQNLYQKFILGNWGEGGATLLAQGSTAIQIVMALVLVGLSLSIAYMGISNIRSARKTGAVAADGGEPSDD